MDKFTSSLEALNDKIDKCADNNAKLTEHWINHCAMINKLENQVKILEEEVIKKIFK